MTAFSAVVISVGGNNIANGSNVEYVEEKYDQLISYIKQINPGCEIVLCSVCPRRDCDASDVNEVITSLAKHYDVVLVNMDRYFLGNDQTPTIRYFSQDHIHLSKSGIRRYLDALQKSTTLRIVKSFDTCVFGYRNASTGYPNRSLNPHFAPKTRYNKCNKCGETNHSTFECRHPDKIQCHECGFLGHKRANCPNRYQ